MVCRVVLDNVLVASRQTHLEHQQLVLELLVQNGLVLILDKCSFAQIEIEYLGHRINSDGIVPLRHHVKCSSPSASSSRCTWFAEIFRND